jgi:recombination protein RecA
MAPASKKKAGKVKGPESEMSAEDIFEAQIAGVGLGGSLRLADTYENNYRVVTSGFPGIDMLISNDEKLQGIPAEVHIEIFSELEHSGKTSFTLAVGVTWQMLGKKVGVIDIEPSITLDYLKIIGFITSKAEAEEMSKKLGRPIYAVRLLQPKVDPLKCESEMVYVDSVLDVVSAASNIFDMLIIDSVDALVSAADAAKTTEQADQMGGVSKQIKSYFRKNTKRRATCWWVNHMSVGLGQYAKSYTTGGKAIPRYSTLRFRLDRIGLVYPSGNTDLDPIGFVTKFSMAKNRLGPIGRSTNLIYLFGEGFSVDYDYFLTALRIGVINKKGGWFYFGTDKDHSKLTINGETNMYQTLKNERPELMVELKHLVDGEDVEVPIEETEISPEDVLAGMDVEDGKDEEQTLPVAA